ncbi:hypothetical protein CR513_36958, partial [Mucuna pruriens]
MSVIILRSGKELPQQQTLITSLKWKIMMFLTVEVILKGFASGTLIVWLVQVSAKVQVCENLIEPYLELQTSKLDNLGSFEKLRQRPTTSLFLVQPSLTICSIKDLHKDVASAL